MNVEKGDPEKRNVFNYHLATCDKRPAMVDDDKEINAKIDSIMTSVAKKKAEEEKKKKAFECPFCGAKYKAENLNHLLQCAVKAESTGGMGGKLKAYFDGK